MLMRVPDTLVGKRDKALLALGSAGAFRRSELVALDVEDLREDPEGLWVLVRWSKVDQEGAGFKKAIPHGRFIRPVALMRDCLDAAGITGRARVRRGCGRRCAARMALWSRSGHSGASTPEHQKRRHEQRTPLTNLAAASAPSNRVPGEDLDKRQDQLLDEAIEETFPASDPISPKRITK